MVWRAIGIDLASLKETNFIRGESPLYFAIQIRGSVHGVNWDFYFLTENGACPVEAPVRNIQVP